MCHPPPRWGRLEGINRRIFKSSFSCAPHHLASVLRSLFLVGGGKICAGFKDLTSSLLKPYVLQERLPAMTVGRTRTQRSSHTSYINPDCAGGQEDSTGSRGGWGGSELHNLETGVLGEVPQVGPCSLLPLPLPPRTSVSDWASPTSEFRGLKSKDRTARVWTQNTEQIGGGLTASVAGEMLRGHFWLLSIQGLGSEQQGALVGEVWWRGAAQCWDALHPPSPQRCGGAIGTRVGLWAAQGRAQGEAGEWTAVSLKQSSSCLECL